MASTCLQASGPFEMIRVFACRPCAMTMLPPSKYSMDTFSPVGLHILVVDDDPLCLLVLERMLKQCSYKDVLRDSEEAVDIVLSDVYMPDVDGFKLLEIIGLELDLPVIMMSMNGNTSVVMKGIIHGACDYLIKPIRMEELRNIWQHVVRRKGTESPNFGLHHGDTESTGLVELAENSLKRRKEGGIGAETMHMVDANDLKRARVNWTVDLHQRFVNAVNQLGVEKAVPKKLLDVMSVKGLTRENVASHLQKYRLYLKRLSGAKPERCPIASFQASKGGKSGGTMRIMPGGKSSASVNAMNGRNISESNAGARSLDANAIVFPQFKAFEKHDANRVQVLSTLGFVESNLNRNASLDMRAYLPKTQLLSTHLMPSVLSTSQSLQLQQGDETGLKPYSAHVEGFVSHWNIKPVPRQMIGESEAAENMHVRENHDNLNSESASNYWPNLDTQSSDDIDTTIADIFYCIPMEGTRDASLDALDLAQNQEQLSVSDYLMDDEDMTFDNQRL